MSDFKPVTSSKANGQIETEKYRSESTGLTVVISQVGVKGEAFLFIWDRCPSVKRVLTKLCKKSKCPF